MPDSADPPDPDSETEPFAETTASVWEHIEDLRWVLIKIIVTLFIAVIAVFCFLLQFKAILDWPLNRALELTGKAETFILYARSPMEPIAVFVQIAFFGGVGLSIPVALYFVAKYLAPALTPRERKILNPICLGILGLFVGGVLFAFLLVIPMMLWASFWMASQIGIGELWSPATYYGTVVWTCLGIGLVFEFPLVLIVAQYLGILEPNDLLHFRRHAFVVIVVLAAVITPTGDPITLGLTTLPLYALYEASIVIGRRLGNGETD